MWYVNLRLLNFIYQILYLHGEIFFVLECQHIYIFILYWLLTDGSINFKMLQLLGSKYSHLFHGVLFGSFSLDSRLLTFDNQPSMFYKAVWSKRFPGCTRISQSWMGHFIVSISQLVRLSFLTLSSSCTPHFSTEAAKLFFFLCSKSTLFHYQVYIIELQSVRWDLWNVP